MTGEAPKEFVKIYKYGKGRAVNPKSWSSYIVKSSLKWYPTESIIEQLNTDIGNLLNFEMAESELFVINGQLRFASRFFLEKDEELLHGADLFAGYLNSKEMVEEIEQKKLHKDFFNVYFVHEVLQKKFTDSWKILFEKFVDMLLLDAFIGVNDRHQYNWGVVRQIEGSRNARFTPLYDTARSLLWNEGDIKLRNKMSSNDFEDWLKNYCLKSYPKLGWENSDNLNHIDLINRLYNCELIDARGKIESLFTKANYERVIYYIEENYLYYLGRERTECIAQLLRTRCELFKETLNLQ